MIRSLWLVPAALLAIVAALVVRARKRRRPAALSVDRVSGEWLAHERAHEEQKW